MNWRTVVKSFRGPFLLLSPACVMLGLASAFYTGLPLNVAHGLLAGFAAVLAHIAVNALNEFEDFKSGLDFKTLRTPFSGGSGALPADSGSATAVKVAGLAALAGVVAIGLYFIAVFGFSLLPLGMLGVLLVLTYTRWLNRYPWLCLIAPGTGFGLIVVTGTHFVATGQFSIVALAGALLVFFLVNNLLLLNQFPDIDADQSIGRRHFPIAYGTRVSAVSYGIFLCAGMATVLVAAASKVFPGSALVVLVLLSAGVYSMAGALRYGAQLGSYTHYLGVNVALTLVAPVLLSLLLFVAA